MKKIFSRRALMGAVAFFGCLAIAVTAVAIPAFGASTRTITVDTDTVLSEDYHGLGDNLWVGPYAYGMNDAYQTVNDQRNNAIKPAYMRMMFLPNWLVDETLSLEKQEYNWTNGIYNWESEAFKAFARNAQTIYNGGTEVCLNMGGRITADMAQWYGIKSVSVTEAGTRSAPKDIDAFARATVAIIKKLKNDYNIDVNYLSFHNEVNGGNFEAFYDKRAYWCEVVKKTSEALDAAELRSIALNKAGTRDGIYIFATELAGWADESPIIEFIEFCDEHLIKKGYADGVSNHQYQHERDYETIVKLSYELRDIFPDIDILINEFNGKDATSGVTNASDFSYKNNAVTNVIVQSWAGYNGAASWFYYGQLIPDPMNVPQSDLNICYWECPSEGLERVSPTLDEKALMVRYIPEHSKVVKTESDSDDIIATTFVKGDDCTVLLEMDKCDSDRNLKVNLGDEFAGKKFGVHLTRVPIDYNENGYTDDEAIPRADGDLLPVRLETITVDSDGCLNWTIPGGKDLMNGNIIFTTLDEQIQVLLDDTELTVAPGGSVDISVKDVFGTECVDFNFEIYDYSSAKDEVEDYQFASEQVLNSIGRLEQNASGIATFTADSNLNVGDTIAIKVTPNETMSDDTAGYAIAIIRVGEYRLYLNNKFAPSRATYNSFMIKSGDVTKIENLYTPSQKGYTFDGWYLTPDFSGEVITETDTNWKSTVHLYGKWTKSE